MVYVDEESLAGVSGELQTDWETLSAAEFRQIRTETTCPLFQRQNRGPLRRLERCLHRVWRRGDHLDHVIAHGVKDELAH